MPGAEAQKEAKYGNARLPVACAELPLPARLPLEGLSDVDVGVESVSQSVSQ